MSAAARTSSSVSWETLLACRRLDLGTHAPPLPGLVEDGETGGLRKRLSQEFQSFDIEFREMIANPVIVPPGRERLDTSPIATGSPLTKRRHRGARSFQGSCGCATVRHDDIEIAARKPGGGTAELRTSIFRVPLLS
jgi:hypothetical protein